MQDEAIDTSYEPFSREPEYIEANRAFVKHLGLEPGTQIVDLACGTATMTDLLLESMYAPDGWPEDLDPAKLDLRQMRVVGLDLSRESLLLGQEHMCGLGFHAGGDPATTSSGVHDRVVLIQASAERIPAADACADLVIMGNAIQLVNDRSAMFSEIARVLRPGGRFAFNTSFYAGTYCEGTEHVYLRWVQEAAGWLARKNAEMKARGEPGFKRSRGTAGRAFSKPWLSIDDYSSEMAEHGLATRMVNERTVMLDKRCFETIGAYAGLAKVLLSGYPVKLASEAMEAAAGPTLEAVGMDLVPRYWLEMVAERA